MHDNVRLLEYFVAVAKQRSFRRAAEHLAISQPPLTRQIHRLEQLVGAPLFVRTSTGVVLTDVGNTLFDHAEHAISVVSTAFEAARAAAGTIEPTLRITATADAYVSALPPILRAFRRARPSTAVDLAVHDNLSDEDYTAHLFAERDDLDIAVVLCARDWHSSRTSLAAERLIGDDWAALLPADHALVGGGPFSLDELLLRSESPPLPNRAYVEQMLGRTPVSDGAGPLRFGARREVDETTLALVAAGYGWTVVPSCHRRQVDDGVVAEPLRDATAPALWIVWRRAGIRPLARQFLSVSRTPDQPRGTVAAPTASPPSAP